MTEEQKKRMQDIYFIAFAARNQIEYWKRNTLLVTPDRVDTILGSLKIAFEGIAKLSEAQEGEESENE